MLFESFLSNRSFQCYYNPIALLFVLLFDNFASSINFDAANCTWLPHTNAPEAYYINMKHSVKRNKSISHVLNQMHLAVNRIEGVSSDQVYIPKDIIKTFQSKSCRFATSESMNRSISLMNQSNNTYIVTGFCLGYLYDRLKPIKTLLIELYVTMAHLLAIHKAVNSPTATSKYALIVEDDMFFPFDVDYNALAAAAPPDFGILQLFTSELSTIPRLWDEYEAQPEMGLWELHSRYAYSAGYYLINREKLKPIINAIVTVDPQYPNIMQFKVIAGRNNGRRCFPIECCPAILSRPLACINSPFAVVDNYIYNMIRTYTSKLPLAFPDLKRDASSVDTRHDHLELTLTKVITSRLQTALQGNHTITLPAYMRYACLI